MRKISLFTCLFAISCFGQITQSIVVPGGGTASNGSIPATCNADCRIEGLVQNWGTPDNSNIFTIGGMSFSYLASGARFQVFWPQGTGGPCIGAVPPVNLSIFSTPNAYFRYQVSVAGNAALAGGAANANSIEFWDAAGNPVYTNTCLYTGHSGATANGATVGDAASTPSTSVGFVREFNTIVSPGAQMPVTSPAGAFAVGEVFEWKFDNSLVDSSGNGYTATLTSVPCVANACYTSTGAVQNLVVSTPKTPDANSFTNWKPWKVGSVNTVTGAASFSQAAASSVPTAYLWTQNTSTSGCAGGETLTLSSTTVVAPTTTPTLFGPVCWDLRVTDTNGNMATSTLVMGAVAFDANGVVTPSDSHVTDIWGPLITFGYNPWGLEDERNMYTVNAQIPYQAAHNDFGWATPGQGTIAYPFAGKGFAPGPACTTLTSDITSSSTSIVVADASCLTLTSLPTWILIGTDVNHVEMMRITATTATTGAATLTVGYDGRGMSGNVTGLGGYNTTVPAQTWLAATAKIGEFRIQGTSTKFGTDPDRPICPAGLPGPPGAVTYSTGTISLTAGSATIVGSGTSWTIGNGVQVGGYVRVTATHASGTPFIFWGQIVTLTDTTHIILDRPAPTGTDATAFSYKITSPAMFLSLEFNAPSPNAHVARLLFNGFGCESETAAFAITTHDLPALDSIYQTGGLKYSYKTFLSEYSSAGTFTPNFYGSCGLMARQFYYRSGYGPALVLANSCDEYWPRDPEIGDGYTGGIPLSNGGGVIGAIADKVLNGSTVLTWPNLEQFAFEGNTGATGCNSNDTRDDAYPSAWLSMIAQFDTGSANWSTFQSYINGSPGILQKDQACKRSSGDGYAGAELNSFANSFVFNPSNGSPNALTLTASSAAVTGSGFTNGLAGSYPDYAGSVPGYCWGIDIVTVTMTHGLSTFTVASGTLTQASLIYIAGTRSSAQYTGLAEYTVSGSSGQLAYAWPGDSGTFSAMSTGGGSIVLGGQLVGGLGSIWSGNPDTLIANRALGVPWACKYNGPTSLTLFRPWDGMNGSYFVSYYNIGAFGQQPFFVGIKSIQMRFGGQNSNSTIANGYAAIRPLTGEWYNSYGWDSSGGHGTFYDTIWQGCGDPSDVATGVFLSIHSAQGCGTSGLASGAAGTARVNSVEGGASMLDYFRQERSLGNATAARAVVDKFYGAIFGDRSLCAATVLSTCDGTTATNMANLDLSQYKWPGFFFGVGGMFTNSWPAMRASAGVAPIITTSSPLPSGITSVPYSQTITATGDISAFTVTSGSLPTGLSLASNGILSGTPTGSGMSSFTITASNGTSPNDAKPFTLTINSALGGSKIGAGVKISGSAVIR